MNAMLFFKPPCEAKRAQKFLNVLFSPSTNYFLFLLLPLSPIFLIALSRKICGRIIIISKKKKFFGSEEVKHEEVSFLKEELCFELKLTTVL
jgi:hypothetical protein